MIEDNWFYYLFVIGTIVLVSIIQTCAGDKKRASDILQENPYIIFAKIIVIQIFFYAILFGFTFSLNVTIQEKFFVTQLFSDYEFSFNSLRGIMGFVALPLSMLFLIFVENAVVQSSRMMWDFSSTLCFLHLIVVSIFIGDFPTNELFWASLGLSFLVVLFLGEYVGFLFETMAYKSTMGANKESPSIELKDVSPKEDAGATFATKDAKHTTHRGRSFGSGSAKRAVSFSPPTTRRLEGQEHPPGDGEGVAERRKKPSEEKERGEGGEAGEREGKGKGKGKKGMVVMVPNPLQHGADSDSREEFADDMTPLSTPSSLRSPSPPPALTTTTTATATATATATRTAANTPSVAQKRPKPPAASPRAASCYPQGEQLQAYVRNLTRNCPLFGRIVPASSAPTKLAQI
eukprot:GCRY01004154.1.p1 GENE.GCRY01004154.1~~GCRY01004154.1.p1  ORF type:complete len:404 (+),score=98.11 GCRY01004154.1:266-1477(+)